MSDFSVWHLTRRAPVSADFDLFRSWSDAIQTADMHHGGRLIWTYDERERVYRSGLWELRERLIR